MTTKFAKVITIVGGALLLFVAIALATTSGWFTLPNAVVQGQTTATSELSNTITVVGEGSVRMRPDIARANIGVEVLRQSVEEATAENRANVENVLAALKELGVAENDIQTSGFSVYAERFGPEGPLAEDDVRYRVSNNVSVTMRDLDNVGALLDAAISAGANNIYGVDFDIDDPSSVESEARAKAVADAQAKAQDLAELTGVTMGNVVSVSEVIGSGYFASNFSEQGMRGLGGGGGAPIEPGELTLVMQLQVQYAISQ